MGNTVTIFEAVSLVEDADQDTNLEDYAAAWQLLIDTGTCWQLQGWFGRTACRLIEDGVCAPPVGTVVRHAND